MCNHENMSRRNETRPRQFIWQISREINSNILQIKNVPVDL